MSPSGNGEFVEYRRLIIDRLDDLGRSYRELVSRVNDIQVEIATLKTSMRIQAALAGSVTSSLVSFIFLKILT